MQSLNKSHKEEVDKLMQQIHSRSDNTFSKLKQAALVRETQQHHLYLIALAHRML